MTQNNIPGHKDHGMSNRKIHIKMKKESGHNKCNECSEILCSALKLTKSDQWHSVFNTL